PTFSIVNEYPGRIPFYHIDLYRVAGDTEVEELGLVEILYGQGAVAIEWPERITKELPEEYLEVQLSFADESSRNIIIIARGRRAEQRLQKLLAFVHKHG
ncbi:MAG: tRNA (adenosine(37)-N6)-threonylcarbamoyltransferase complex ATPase subunit type 1 TsaE, partial [Deltaproteobacteria bacterium]|nr:tRNA (adenosine(37)-N6)-threonylcarbamoyltransferase complex ATPase subunit type 1 TsaE [Deltaproteobacteria bacterium]